MISNDPVFQAAVVALIGAGGFTLLTDGPAVDVWFDASHVVTVFDASASWNPDFGAAMEHFWRTREGDTVDAVIVGGDRANFDMVLARRPTFTGSRTLGAAWISTDGAITLERCSTRVSGALRDAFAQGVPPPQEPAALRALLDEATRRGRAQTEELRAFQGKVAAAPARVTQALFAVVALLFVAKLAIGEHGVATDVRMGAVVVGRTLAEPWRLVSHAFLHANLQHVAFNGLTLLSLGMFYEGLLGRWRFATLFVLAAIGGGLAATFGSPSTVMVGASGSLWGMLGASFALAIRPGDTLPAAMLPGFRRNALINLVMQVSVSLMPNVSALAHLGGGVVGFVLVLTGVLRPRADGRGERAFGAIGRLSLAAAVACLGAALLMGKPWELLSPPALRAYRLEGTPVTLSLPARPVPVGQGTDPQEYAVSDAYDEGFVLAVQVSRNTEPMPLGELAAAAEELRTSLGALGHPTNASVSGPLRVEQRNAQVWLAQDFTMPDNVRFENRLVLRTGVSVSVQIVRRADDERSSGMANRIVESVRE